MTIRPTRGLSVRFFLLALLTTCSVPAWAQTLTPLNGPDFGTRSIGEIQIPLRVSGGDGSYTWELVSGPLPDGVALRTDGPSWFPPDFSAALIGVATTPGTFPFTLRVTSGGESLEISYTVKISPLVVTEYWRRGDAFVGKPYSRTLTAQNNTGDVTWTIEGGLPPGITLSSSGVLSGVPEAPGFYNVTFYANDDNDSVWRDVNLDVYAVEITTPGTLPNAFQGASYSATIEASGGVEPYTFSSNGLPNGLFLASSGEISGTTNSGPGNYRLDVTARDANGVFYTKRMAIDVIGVPPALPSIGSSFDSSTLGRPYTTNVWISSGGTAPFTWTASGLPSGLSIRWGSGNTVPWFTPGELEISGAPTQIGDFDVQFTVTDANGKTATNTFPLHVSTLTASFDSPPATIFTPYSATLRILGGAAPYTGTLIEGRLPAGITLNPTSLELSGTPLESGGFDATFLVTDAGGATLRTDQFFFVNNASPLGVNHGGDFGYVTQGQFYSNQLFACCVASYEWTVRPEGGPLPAGLSLSTSGRLSGTPTAGGTYTFLIRAEDASDPGSFAQRQFTMVVTPISINGNFTLPDGFVNSAYSKSMAATGATGSVTWTLAPRSYPPPGLTLSSAGVLSGTPTASGQFVFEVIAADAFNQSRRSFGVSIYAEGDQPPLTILTGPDFGTRSIGEVQQQLTASGGNGSYSWTFVSGILPPGVSVRPDGPSWFQADASGGLIGIATTPGLYHFTLRVTSGADSLDRAFTLRISPLVITTHWDVPDTFVGKPFSYTLTAGNVPGPFMWTAESGLPDGVTLSPAGMLAGTPTQSGFYSIWLYVSDGTDTVGRQVNVQVYDIEITTPGELPNATQNAPYSATIAAQGGTGPYTFSSDSLPNGLVLHPSGTISGTANAGPHNYSFNVTATDSNHVSYTRRMAIDVVGVPPTLPSISIDFRDATLGWPFEQSVQVGNGGTAPFTWTATGLPPGLSIRWGSANTKSWVTPGNLEITGAPTALGTYPVTLTVTDANGKTASNTFPLRVSSLLQYLLNNPPGTIFTPYARKLRIIGGTLPYGATQVSGRLPAGVLFNPATFDISGIPLENGFFGTDFVVTDSALATLRTGFFDEIGGGGSTIDINHGGDLGYVRLGSSYSNDLPACCVPSYAWTVEDGTLPPGLTLGPGGRLSGTPTTVGTYTFLVRVADATHPSNFGQRQFSIVITPLQIQGNFTLPNAFVSSGSPYSVSFNAVGGAGTLQWTVAPGNLLPPGLTLSSSGTLSGTPTASGQFFFDLIVSDGPFQTRRRFGVSIYAVGDFPPLALQQGPDLGTWSLGGVFLELTATGGLPPYHYSITPGPTVPTVPGMRVQDGPPQPTFFTPGTTGSFIGVITTPGTHHTSIRVTDSAGHTFDQPITIRVSALRTLSASFRPPKATLGQPYSFTFVGYGGSGNYSWSAENLPAGLTLDSSGQLHGTPTQAGSFFPTLRLDDPSTSDFVWEGIGLIVDPFAITTDGVLPSGTTQLFYSQTLTANCGGACTWSTQGSLPSGLSLSSAGVLSGTPNGTFNGSFTVTASGPAGTVQKIVALRIVGTLTQALTITTGSIGDRAVGDAAQVALFAQGGSPPYTWSVVSGSLPAGISLQSPGEAFSANFAPGFTYLGGRAMQVGTSPFTLQVMDSLGATTTRVFTWRVSALLWMESNLPVSPGAPLVYNMPYTYPLLVVGGTGHYTWTSAGNPMPPGLNVGATTGVVSGTPTNTGSFSSGIQVADDGGNVVFQNLNFSIAGPTPTLVSFSLGANLGTVPQGSTLSRTLGPFGGTPPYTITALSSLPPGFSLLSGDSLTTNFGPGSYGLTAVPLAGGDFSFTLKAQDSLGNIGVRTFTVSVAPLTLFTTTILADGSVGASYSQPLLLWSTGGATWSVSPGSVMPPGLDVSSSGVINGIPTAPGSYNFFLTADGSGASISFGFTLRISSLAITDGPILPVAVAGIPYTHAFTATGGGSVVWSATGVPAGFTMSPTGTLSGTSSVAAGSTVNLVVTATDGVRPVAKRFVLYIRTANAGQLTSSLLSAALPDATVGQSFSATLNSSGGLPPYSWALASGSLPPGLSLISGSLLPPNVVPGATLLAGAPTVAGTYAFDLILSDSAAAHVRRTFTLNVSPLGLAPGDPRTATAGVPYAFQFTAVGGTPDNVFTAAPTTLLQDVLPPGLSLSPSGLLSGTPTGTGSYSFVLRVVDGAGRVLTRNAFIDVTNAFGVLLGAQNPADGSVGSGRSEQVFPVNFSGGSSTYTWSVVTGSLPPGMTLEQTPGFAQLVGRPTVPGTYTYTLRATDTANGANVADREFRFRVSPMQLVSPAIELIGAGDLPSAHEGSIYSFAFKVAGGTLPYVFSESPFSPLPAGLTLTPAGLLTGSPLVSGAFIVSPIITDGTGLIVNAPSFNLIVTPSGVPSPLTTVVPTRPLFDASLGVPYSFILDTPFSSLSRRGVPPYSWSLVGGSLPPGVAILAGANGVPTQLGGVPSATGNYAATLRVTDASGQSSTVNVTIRVASLALTPDGAPVGTTGDAYSVSLVPSGGTPPYAVQLDSTSDLPPGLALGGSGVLSGVPNHPGNFLVGVTVIDSGGATLSKVYRITIDNAAGQAPALSLAPRPIQVYWEQGSPAPSASAIAVETTSGALPFSLAVSGVPGASLSAAAGTTSSIVSLNWSLAALPAGTYIGALGASAPLAANLVDSVPVTVTVAPPPPCSYTLNPSAGSVAAAGGAGSFDLATGATCAWSASTTAPWLALTSSASGTGATTVSFSVAPNVTGPRTGTIVVQGKVYTVTQFGTGCSFAISPVSLGAPAAGGTASIAITASDAACPPWTATGLGALPSSGSGSGSVTIAVPPNFSPSAQLLTATIAGQTLSVTQAGAGCTVTLSPYDASFPADGGDGSVIVTTPGGCGYNTVLGPSWIEVTSGGSGSGSGTLVYTVQANSTTIARSGSLTIGGQTFQVTQDALPCSVTIDTSGLGTPYGPAGGAGLVGITTNGANCAWTASSGAAWASVSPPSGTGNGTVGVTVGSNTSSAVARSIDLTIAGQTVTVLQTGTTCLYSLQSDAGSVPAGGGTGTVGVVTPNVCSWTAATNTPSWLSVGSPGGTGSSSVPFVALANTTALARTGTLTIAGRTYTVTQAPAPCAYTLVGSPTTVSSGGVTSAIFNFSTTATGCTPTPLSYVGWIDVVGTSFSGGAGSVTYSVEPNPATTTRAGTIQLGDRTFEVRQTGGACGYSLSVYGALFGHIGGTSHFFGSPSGVGCTPDTGTDQPSFILLDTLVGPVSNIFTQGYHVTPYDSLTLSIRRARITFGGQVFTVKQTSW